jgi:hypothetical protein
VRQPLFSFAKKKNSDLQCSSQWTSGDSAKLCCTCDLSLQGDGVYRCNKYINTERSYLTAIDFRAYMIFLLRENIPNM